MRVLDTDELSGAVMVCGCVIISRVWWAVDIVGGAGACRIDNVDIE